MAYSDSGPYGQRIDTTGEHFLPGDPIRIDQLGQNTNHIPTLPNSLALNGVEFQMSILEYRPPQKYYNAQGCTLFSNHASGGCVIICAAEIGANGTALWSYLVHAHGCAKMMDITEGSNPNNIHVCLLFFSDAFPVRTPGEHNYSELTERLIYLKELDPRHQIPESNVKSIWGRHTSLAITSEGAVAVNTLPHELVRG